MRAILTYHSIDESGSAISCHPDAFDRHVHWLTSGAVEVTTIEGLLALPDSADAVAITFDDGFANFADRAAPRLLDAGLPSTLFVVSDHVGRSNAWEGADPRIPVLPLLDWHALATLRAAGVSIGAHTKTHPDLTARPPDAVEAELRGCADAVQHHIGVRPETFAYPYGRTNDDVASAAERVYAFSCTTEFRAIEGAVDPRRIPRLDAYYFQRPGTLERWGTDRFARLVRRRNRMRQVRRAVVDRVISLGGRR